MSNAPRAALNTVQQDVSFPEKGLFLTAAAQLAVHQQRVRCLANTTYTSYTVTLPPVAEAAGFFYSIYATIADAQAVTVTDAGDEPDFTNLTLDTDGDAALLYSDGARWFVVANDIA